MSQWIEDYRTFAAADGLVFESPLRAWRKCVRISRRALNRCLLEKSVFNQPRVFCQNSGGCGSTYIVRLLQANGVSNCFHEKTPDLNKLGIEHFDHPVSQQRLVRLLRYTRHDCYFESNNRLFSFSKAIRAAFPCSRFIHLHRHGADAVASAMSKPDIESYLKNGVRFQGSLAGNPTAAPFERFCHYWANMNQRILDDIQSLGLAGHEFLSLRFDQLTGGDVESLEMFLKLKLKTRVLPPANVGRVSAAGKFPRFENWGGTQRETFAEICGPVLQRLGYETVPATTGRASAI